MCIVESRNPLQPSLNMLSNLGAELQWLSWPGCVGVTQYAKNGISNHMQEKYNCYPVFLNADTAQSYMEFCDEVFCIQYFLVRWQLIAGQIPHCRANVVTTP